MNHVREQSFSLKRNRVGNDVGLTKFVFHKLCELRRIVPAVDDILKEVFLLHGPELLVCVLLFVEAAAGHWHPIGVCVELLLLLEVLGLTLSSRGVAAVTRLFNHVCNLMCFRALFNNDFFSSRI